MKSERYGNIDANQNIPKVAQTLEHAIHTAHQAWADKLMPFTPLNEKEPERGYDLAKSFIEPHSKLIQQASSGELVHYLDQLEPIQISREFKSEPVVFFPNGLFASSVINLSSANYFEGTFMYDYVGYDLQAGKTLHIKNDSTSRDIGRHAHGTIVNDSTHIDDLGIEAHGALLINRGYANTLGMVSTNSTLINLGSVHSEFGFDAKQSKMLNLGHYGDEYHIADGIAIDPQPGAYIFTTYSPDEDDVKDFMLLTSDHDFMRVRLQLDDTNEAIVIDSGTDYDPSMKRHLIMSGYLCRGAEIDTFVSYVRSVNSLLTETSVQKILEFNWNDYFKTVEKGVDTLR